jgi:hypothetical protein
LALLQQGEQHAAGGKFEAASICFESALRSVSSRAVLLSNRSLCHSKLPHSVLFWLLDACAALTLDPTLVKAMYRQAEALIFLRQFQQANAVCTHALAMQGMNESFRQIISQLQQRIVREAAKGTSGASVAGLSLAASLPSRTSPLATFQ